MKTKIYSLLFVACCVMASFTSCLEFTELKSNIPESVKTETAETELEGYDTYLNLHGTSDVMYEHAYFLLSTSQDMADAMEISAKVAPSGSIYKYSATYGPVYPGVTYYYQLVIGGVKSEISKIKMNDPAVEIPEDGAKLYERTVSLYGLATPNPSECYFLIGTSDNKDEAMAVDASLGDYVEGKRICYATYKGLDCGTKYFYWLVAVYPDGNGGKTPFYSFIGTFETPAELQIVSAKYLPHEAQSASDAVNCEEWDIWDFVLEDVNTETFTTYKASKKWDVTSGFAGWEIFCDGKPCAITLGKEEKTLYGYNYAGENQYKSTVLVGNNSFQPFYYAKVEGISENNSNVDVLMTSPNAKVNISFVTTKENPETRLIYEVQIASKSLSQKGYFDMKTEKYIKTVPWQLQTVKSKFYLNTTPVTSSLYLIPGNTEDGTVMTVLFEDNTSKSITLPATALEAGKIYTFPVTIDRGRLSLGDVVVEEWQNGEGGNMNIK